MPGPPPKPAAIKRRDGNPGRRPIVDEARVGSMVARVEDFPAPASLPESAANVWREIVPEVVELGLVRSVDTTALEALARAVARAREAEALLDRDGVVIEGARGNLVAHPAERIARDSWALALRIAGEYGLTAVARLRVGAAVLHQRSLADELLSVLDGPDEPDVIAVEPAGIVEVLAELDDEDEPKPKPRRKTAAKRKRA